MHYTTPTVQFTKRKVCTYLKETRSTSVTKTSLFKPCRKVRNCSLYRKSRETRT